MEDTSNTIDSLNNQRPIVSTITTVAGNGTGVNQTETLDDLETDTKWEMTTLEKASFEPDPQLDDTSIDEVRQHDEQEAEGEVIGEDEELEDRGIQCHEEKINLASAEEAQEEIPSAKVEAMSAEQTIESTIDPAMADIESLKKSQNDSESLESVDELSGLNYELMKQIGTDITEPAVELGKINDDLMKQIDDSIAGPTEDHQEPPEKLKPLEQVENVPGNTQVTELELSVPKEELAKEKIQKHEDSIIPVEAFSALVEELDKPIDGPEPVEVMVREEAQDKQQTENQLAHQEEQTEQSVKLINQSNENSKKVPTEPVDEQSETIEEQSEPIHNDSDRPEIFEEQPSEHEEQPPVPKEDPQELLSHQDDESGKLNEKTVKSPEQCEETQNQPEELKEQFEVPTEKPETRRKSSRQIKKSRSVMEAPESDNEVGSKPEQPIRSLRIRISRRPEHATTPLKIETPPQSESQEKPEKPETPETPEKLEKLERHEKHIKPDKPTKLKLERKATKRALSKSNVEDESVEPKRKPTFVSRPIESRMTISTSAPSSRPNIRKRLDTSFDEKKYYCEKCEYSTDRLNNIVYHKTKIEACKYRLAAWQKEVDGFKYHRK